MAKKIWERMQEDAEANKLENERIRQEANQKFQQERERDNEIKNRIIQTSRLPLMNTVRTMADNANDYRQKTREQITNRVSNMSAIKTLNNMIDNVDTSNLPNTTIGNLYRTVLDTAKTMTPQQRIRPYVDIQQDSKESMIKATNYINQRLNRPLWDQIVDTASDFGRTTENTWLGGKHAVEDAENYIDTMLNGYKTQQEKTIGKAFFSNKLNNDEKWSYIISQTANRKNYENTVRNKIDQAFPGLDKKMQDMIVQSEMKKFDKAFENEQLRNQVNNISNIYNNNKEKIDNIVNEDFNNRRSEDEKISKNIEQQTNPLSKKLAEIAPSIGQMGVGTALSIINPVLGTAYFTSSAGGGYLNDAIERGMTPSQAKNYATVMGLAEGLTEELTVGNFKKAGDTVKSIIKGTGKEVAKEGAKQVATQTMKEALKDYGIGIAENMLQEAVMEPLQETMAGAIGGQDKANWDNMLDRMWNSGINGGLVAVITGGGKLASSYSRAIIENKLSKGITPTQEESKTAIQEEIKERGQEAVNKDFIRGVEIGVNAVKNEISQQNQQTTQNNQVPVQENVSNQNVVANNQETLYNNIKLGEIKNVPIQVERPEGKFRKHYQSIIESSNTTAEAKAIAKEMMGLDTYTPQSNESLLQKADRRISMADPNTELNSLLSRAMNNDKISDTDIAVGERLIEYYSKIGDAEHLQDAIHATALAGTQAGRTVQALALLNHMTPQGQLVWLQRSIEKMNDSLQQKYKNKSNVPQFELTQEMTDKILNTNSKEEMYEVLDNVYEELGQQVPKTMSEKIDEWRYFSMLANIKTHNRNIIGNVAMHATQRVKDKMAGAIEGVVSKFNTNMERTHTIMPASKETKQFAKNDVKNMDVQTQLGMNENKYNPQSRLQNARKTFKHDILNNTLGKLFDVNTKLLEVEDNIGLKSMYVKALSDYITANKIDVNSITDAQLSKARQHAIKSAQEATFHQASSLATALQQMGNKNNLTKFALDAVVPFKKTPINVAKTGAQYSPIGLIKSAIFDVNKVRKGTMTANQYIDNISKGLTGTGITFLGYALAEAGILKASGGDDDKKEKYDEEQGKQSYALEIGGNTYSLDWLSPVGIPLFIGAETNQQFNQAKKEKNSKSTDDEETLSNILKGLANFANGVSNAMNPMSEMSMVSGLTNVLSSYNKENAVGDMIVNTGKSYVNQFVPTLLGQVARTTDDYERTTQSTKTGTLEKAFDSTINQIKSKIPGLRQTLPVKTDIWGKDVKQSENLPFRAFNNFINPAKVQEVSTDKVDKELNNLYARTGESSIIPKSIDKNLTINKNNYRMTNEEYAKYAKDYGKTSYKLIRDLISSQDYKDLTDKQKQKAIEDIYSYAKESNKVDYSNKVKEELETSSLYNTIEDLKKNGGEVSAYLNYKGKVSDIEGEKETMQKNTVLKNSNYSNKTKSIIYRNNTGKNDKLYNLVPNINMNQYLDYKIKNSNEEFKADKDSNGKTITGSAKKKVYNYINSTISGYDNRLMLLGNEYKLSRAEQQEIANQINKTSKSNEEAMDKFKKLSSNFEVKDGKVYFK